MKKYLLGILCLFTMTAAHAVNGNPDHVGGLCGQILVGDTTAYYTLSDGTFWKTSAFVTRWRSPLEWWNGVEVAPPESLRCTPKDWTLGAPIAVYAKFGMEIDISNASNLEELKKCTHVLVNQHTGQVLFGVALAPAVAMTEIFNTGVAAGYNDGLQKGHREGHQAAYQNGYNKGYAEGRTKGEAQGYELGFACGQAEMRGDRNH